jgi:hypothetical protein
VFDVVPSPDTIVALNGVCATRSDIHLAVVALRQFPGTPDGLSFAKMLKFRDKTA